MAIKQKKQAAITLPKTGRPVKVALLGFGTVGSSVARVLAASKLPGVELTHIFNRNVERKTQLRSRKNCAGVGGVDRQHRGYSSVECGRCG